MAAASSKGSLRLLVSNVAVQFFIFRGRSFVFADFILEAGRNR
jgi:hypothetical protein